MLRNPLLWAGLIACLTLPAGVAASGNSQSLSAFMQQVWEQHPEIHAAQASLEAAQAQAKAAGKALYNPELELDAEKATANTFSIGVNQTIDWGDKRGAQRNVGHAGIQLAQAELASVRQQLGSEVLTSLVQYRATLKLLDLAEQRAKFTGRLVETTEQRHAAGDISQLDVALARVAHSQSRMQVSKRKAEAASRRAALIAASGGAFSSIPKLPTQAPVPPANPDRDALLAKLPTLQAAQAQVQIAKSNTDLAKTYRSTTPTVGLRGGREDQELLLGLNLSIPLMVRNNFTAEVTAASHLIVQQEQQLLFDYQRAASHLDGSLAAYRLTFDAWQQWQETGEKNLSQQLQLLQQIWRSGEISTSEYLLQARQNVDARETAAELKADMWATWVEWLNTSGNLEAWISQAANSQAP